MRSRTGWDVCKPVKPDTIAKSLAIGNPADGPYALDLARRTGGSIDSVTDDEILEGIRLLAETTGIFTETAGGVTTAVLRSWPSAATSARTSGWCCVITGEGLKTLDAVRGTFETVRDRAVARGVRGRASPETPSALCNLPVPMAVTVKIPTQLRSVTGGESETAVDGATTVGEVLDGLYDRFDGLRDRIAEDGDLRRFVNVYVRGEDIRFLDGLDTSVEDGDEVTILPAVAGGS